jgi:hypothetical protein
MGKYIIPLDYYETKQIADFITKTENSDEDYSITENALADKWGIDLDIFHEIANKIFKMIDFSTSPITQVPYVGISSGSFWFAKRPVNQQFINAIINWATEGEDIHEKGKGFKRVITLNNEPEYEITIKKL